METKKKSRKPRIVKGGYINLDDVTEGPGPSFSNWIFYAKIKLKEREIKLMKVRLNKIKSIISQNIAKFERDNEFHNICIVIPKIETTDFFDNKLNDKLIESAICELDKILILWKGINTDQTSKELSTFRIYFGTSRNWFDQKKKNIKAKYFWLKILNSIQQFVLKVSENFVDDQYPELQFKHYHHLLKQVLFLSK